MSQKKLWIGTSWKMNHLRSSAVAYAEEIRRSPFAQAAHLQPFVIPPFPYVAEVANILHGSSVLVGGQNMHWMDQGAWTGEVSAPMLKDCGARVVEIGHSERRTHFGETDETVALKVEAALRHDLIPVVCIGDTQAEHAAKQTAAALERQLRALLSRVPAGKAANIVIAYEPVWSIGEGGTPAAPAFVAEQHERIHKRAMDLTGETIPVIYGGSVSLANAVALAQTPFVSGIFIGRAALEANGFLAIMQAITESLGGRT